MGTALKPEGIARRCFTLSGRRGGARLCRSCEVADGEPDERVRLTGERLNLRERLRTGRRRERKERRVAGERGMRCLPDRLLCRSITARGERRL